MRKRPTTAPRGWSLVLGVFLVALVVSSLYAMRLAQIYEAERELLRLREEIDYLTPYLPKSADLQASLKQAEEEYGEVSALDDDNVPFWVLLAKTSNLFDEAAWIERLSIAADGSVSIKGRALSYASVSDTLSSFDSDSLFGTAQLTTAYVFQLIQEQSVYAVGFEMGTSVQRGGGQSWH